jgi:hypothetical protein
MTYSTIDFTTPTYQTKGIYHWAMNGTRKQGKLAVVTSNNGYNLIAICRESEVAASIAREATRKGEFKVTCRWVTIEDLKVTLNETITRLSGYSGKGVTIEKLKVTLEIVKQFC